MALITSAKEFVKNALDELQKKIYPEELAFAKRLFEIKKRELINLIRTHPVSQELINHTEPSRILKTKGSLYGFLGFQYPFNPVDKICEIVEQKLSYRVRKKLLGRGFYIEMTVPEPRDFRVKELILPWEGGHSVIDAIERGVSGLNHYIKAKNSPYSRSGDGIQAKNPVRKAIRQSYFRGVPYLTQIIDRLRQEGRKEVVSLK